MQADQKLSYALINCNPRSEANIRSVSAVLIVYVLHPHGRKTLDVSVSTIIGVLSSIYLLLWLYCIWFS